MKQILLLSLAFLAVGCAPQTTPADAPTSVTVIFKDAPAQSSTDRFLGTLSVMPEGTAEIVDSLGRLVRYAPRTVGYDTITLPAPMGYAELLHRNQAVEELPYLFIAGDTVLFTYGDNLRPQAQSLTSEVNTRLYNLLWDDVRAVQPVGYSTSAVLAYDYYRMADRMIHHPQKHYTPEALVSFKRFCINLDSLRPIYTAWQVELERRIDSLETAGEIPALYAEYLRAQSRVEEGEIVLTDSMMHYPSAHKKAMRKAFALAPGESRSTQIFDRIAPDTTLLASVRNTILRQLMTSIENGDYWGGGYPPAMVQQYRDNYQRITGDTTFRFQMIEKQNLVIGGYATDLVLEGLDGSQHNYGDILTRHKGKVIYVDLWASWCGPCCAGMPAAKVLREKYKGRDVVFLYLAVNDGREPWQSAVRKQQTDYLGENYRILNADDSEFLRQIKHRRIPHLLLYDRTGELVDLDAPRAESPEITPLLEKYLK